MNQEYQLQQLRKILLDETLPNSERIAAQKTIMKILGLKEDHNNTKREDIKV